MQQYRQCGINYLLLRLGVLLSVCNNKVVTVTESMRFTLLWLKLLVTHKFGYQPIPSSAPTSSAVSAQRPTLNGWHKTCSNRDMSTSKDKTILTLCVTADSGPS
jgi:hypothetical protein